MRRRDCRGRRRSDRVQRWEWGGAHPGSRCSAKARKKAAWRRLTSSNSPDAPSRSSPNSRIVSSIEKRGSPSAASTRCRRLLSTREVDARRGDRRRGHPARWRSPPRPRRCTRRRRWPGAGRAAAPARRADRSSRRWCRASSAGGPGDLARRRSERRKRRSSRASSAAGESTLTRAAASSMASGNPSRRRQIAATVAAFSAVKANASRTAARVQRRVWTAGDSAAAS